jgi:hypothetical protein
LVAATASVNYNDASKWDIDTERDASELDAGYYGKLGESVEGSGICV